MDPFARDEPKPVSRFEDVCAWIVLAVLFAVALFA